MCLVPGSVCTEYRASKGMGGRDVNRHGGSVDILAANGNVTAEEEALFVEGEKEFSLLTERVERLRPTVLELLLLMPLRRGVVPTL